VRDLVQLSKQLRLCVGYFAGFDLYIQGESWNLGRPFSRPGKSWKTAKVMENDDNVMEFLERKVPDPKTRS